jgi:hypothetical protein
VQVSRIELGSSSDEPALAGDKTTSREDHAVRSTDPLAPPFYPVDLLPAMQGLLAAVADLETRNEIERERIEQGSGSEKIKQRELAELEAAHQHRCGLYEQQWDELQSRQGWCHIYAQV